MCSRAEKGVERGTSVVITSLQGCSSVHTYLGVSATEPNETLFLVSCYRVSL